MFVAASATSKNILSTLFDKNNPVEILAAKFTVPRLPDWNFLCLLASVSDGDLCIEIDTIGCLVNFVSHNPSPKIPGARPGICSAVN